MILAGDIGGTKTHLALFTDDGEGPLRLSTYQSAEYDEPTSLVETFLSDHAGEVRYACLGVAGPVADGAVSSVNLPWPVYAHELVEVLDLPGALVINDLEANAWGISALGSEEFAVLNEGDPEARGNAAVVSAGTGLGEAGLYWDGRIHRPFASEGGHTDFAPRSKIEAALWRDLVADYGHVSYERVCSGGGLANIYRFLGGPAADPGAISRAALERSDDRAVRALDLMVSIYGAEAGNVGLKFMATGGIYLGGGIPPKILPKLADGSFMRAFTDKGRFSSLLERIPVRVILNDKAALLGAARCAVDALARQTAVAPYPPTLARSE
jgi:glucokinase